MKNKLSKSAMAIALLMMVQGLAVQGALADENRVMVMKPETVFTPKGFSNHNNAEVVVLGNFRSFCFKVAPPKFKVDTKNFKIYIVNSAYASPGCADALVYIPYTTVVSLGELPVGNYEVFTLDANGVYGKQADLPVAQALLKQDGRDDYLYAPVTEVAFDYKNGLVAPVLTLKGVFTNSCLSLQKVEVNVRDGNVLEILPLVKMDTVNCKNQATAFSTSVTLDNFPKENTLLHIRSMNGQAINRVITVVDRIPRP